MPPVALSVDRPWRVEVIQTSCGGNKAGNEPAICVSREEHDLITQAQRTRTAPASARDLLADDIRMLRKHTNAPRQKMKDLIELNNKLHESDYNALHRMGDKP